VSTNLSWRDKLKPDLFGWISVCIFAINTIMILLGGYEHSILGMATWFFVLPAGLLFSFIGIFVDRRRVKAILSLVLFIVLWPATFIILILLHEIL